MPRGKISNRKAGKLADTWIFEYEGVDQSLGGQENLEDVQHLVAKGIKVPVKLYIHKKFGESNQPPLRTNEVWFSVECDEPSFSISGSDIEALRTAMWAHLSRHFAVKWENYFKVHVSSVYSHYGMRFEFETVERGTAWDGSLLLRERVFGRGEVVRPWPGEFRDGQGQVMACIPASPENARALKEFGERINELRKCLADFLRPDVILQTLAGLNNIAMLPTLPSKPPTDEED